MLKFLSSTAVIIVIWSTLVIGHTSTTSIWSVNNVEELNANLYNYKCFPDKESSTSTLNVHQIGLQVTSWPSHQLLTRIFALFLRDVLNYRKVYLFPIEYNQNLDNSTYERNKLFNAMDLMDNLRYPNLWMMNVGVSMGSMGHALKPNSVHEAGVSMHPVRFGWFATKQRSGSTPYDYLHYSIFLNQSHPMYRQFVMYDDELLDLLKLGNDSSTFISPACEKTNCVTLLAGNKNDTSFVQHQIREMKAFVNILWLGSSFRSELNRLYAYYGSGKLDKRLVILHWTPSDVIENLDFFELVVQPLCEDLQSLQQSYCKYDSNPIIKYYTHIAGNDERLMFALRYFWINPKDMKSLFKQMNQDRLVHGGNLSAGIYDRLACDWMQNKSTDYNKWISKQRVTLSIGGIFPITKNSRGHQNLVEAVKRAAKAIDESTTILSNYNFRMIVNDGECQPDITMKTFLHYHKDPHVIGILGPSCSETVEPIAGISRHTKMVVISYSAEGASFVDRQAYPYFFRTIGSNRQYEDVYVGLMKSFGWKRVAALTEDGQKHTEYISHMESALKMNHMELLISKKFLSDISSVEMNKYLMDLKQRHAKIIIADIHNKYAAMAMCEASKLEMTAYQGYVWFFPSWISKAWDSLIVESNITCSAEELEKAFNGHFSIMHSPFGDNETLMEENISIKHWIDSYSSSVDSISKYTAFAYDAVWVYAKAVDKLLQENKEFAEDFRSSFVVNRMSELIWETDFEGLSGRVRFGQGGSRITELIITQWLDNAAVDVGRFIPKILGAGRNLRTVGGDLILNNNSVKWFSDKTPPGDGSFDCSFATLAEFLNTECENTAVAFTAVICLIAVFCISLISFWFWKRRYDKKLKRSAKIMKNFGIDLLSPSRSNANTLDKWEIPKENVVINRRLGEGAFGTVYGGEAQIGSEGWTAVAVKTLKSGASTEDRLDFLSEAEAMKRFDHKNIVKLLGVCLQSEPIYTIMEFMLYGDLKTYLLARRHMVNEKIGDSSDISSKRLTMYAMDIARGLSYLGQRKYVHRDVACRNCLVNTQRVVKLGDFGMARSIYESDYYRFNRKGMLPVRWMAPESLALGMFTPASDVWGFAVVLFEIITFGSFPYQGLTNNQVLEFVKSGNTLQIPPGIRPQLEGLIKACWNSDSKKRPTALEIVEYIAKFPTLLTPCLDFPSASVEMHDTESEALELLPQISDAGLDIIAQTSLVDALSRFNDVINVDEDDYHNNEQINIEMTTQISSGEADALSPLTPDGYSFMSPLLTRPTDEVP